MTRATPLVQRWYETNDVPLPDAATKTAARRQAMRRVGSGRNPSRKSRVARKWTVKRKPLTKTKALGDLMFVVGAMVITAVLMALAI